MNKFFKINEEDNVVVALMDLPKDTKIIVDNQEIEINEDIKKGNKIAIAHIKKSHNVIKYGYAIGHATQKISMGDWVHTHNTKTNLEGTLEYRYEKNTKEIVEESRNLTFKGYKRLDGSVGIRNELWIVPTVGCVNGIAENIIKKFKEEVKLDGIEIFKHNYGCSQLGDDHDNTKKILQDIVKHPNTGGVLVFGLGCENNYISEFRESLGEYDRSRVRFLVAQEVSDEVREGADILNRLYQNMLQDRRTQVPISELKIGLKCGGSDGLSGITANPLLGAFSDFLISQGGTTILTEVPEMFGAETILMNRCIDEGIFNKTVDLINNFKEYFMKHNQPIYENPSPGNKAGGITTLEDKSLGCTQKGGTATVIDVLKYGQILKTRGLNLLESPGNDLVASTALGASGCQMVLFTTGRGTPFGSFVPTVKISTNSDLYNFKPHWVDFNAGSLVEGKSMQDVLEEFIDYIIKVANGQLVNNEKDGFKEIAIFKTGVTL